jgi:hypothetical protein
MDNSAEELPVKVQGVSKRALQLRKLRHLFRDNIQCFELSYCSRKPHVLPGIIAVHCDLHC